MINRRIFRCGSGYRLPLLPLRSHLGLAPPPPAHPLARLNLLLVSFGLCVPSTTFGALPQLLGLGVPALLARALCRSDLALLARSRRPSAFVADMRAGGRARRSSAPPLRLCRISAGGRASRRSAVLGLPDKRTTHPRPPRFIG